MDENMSQAISMFGAALLFVFALSYAIFAYNGLTDRADMFFDANIIAGKREEATTTHGNSDEFKRKATFPEIYMAILDLPKYVSEAGNSGVSKIQINTAAGSSTYTAEVDTVLNIRKIKLDSTFIPSDPDGYTYGDSNHMLDLLQDFCLVALDDSGTGSTSNQVLRDSGRAALIESTTFSVQYTEDEIIYTRN